MTALVFPASAGNASSCEVLLSGAALRSRRVAFLLTAELQHTDAKGNTEALPPGLYQVASSVQGPNHALHDAQGWFRPEQHMVCSPVCAYQVVHRRCRMSPVRICQNGGFCFKLHGWAPPEFLDGVGEERTTTSPKTWYCPRIG